MYKKVPSAPFVDSKIHSPPYNFLGLPRTAALSLLVLAIYYSSYYFNYLSTTYPTITVIAAPPPPHKPSRTLIRQRPTVSPQYQHQAHYALDPRTTRTTVALTIRHHPPKSTSSPLLVSTTQVPIILTCPPPPPRPYINVVPLLTSPDSTIHKFSPTPAIFA